MSLGKQIAHYRRNKNITQDALAKQLGISNQAVSKWETEQSYPDVELLPKIADIFEITLDELFEREFKQAEAASGFTPTGSGNDASTKTASATAILEASTILPPFYGLLPWENDEKLRVVLFQGHDLIQKDELKKRFGKICNDITFNYCGPALNIESCFNVSCEDVSGWITAGGRVECENVSGWITAGGYVECENVGQYVIAGGYVECEDVGQNVTAGGYIECGDVGGNISADGNVECGDVTQNVTAGSYVECGDVGGDVSAGGNVDCGDVAGNVNTSGRINQG